MLLSDEKYGFIIMDGNGVLLSSVTGSDIKILSHYEVDLPKKHRRGGQSAMRFLRLRLEARHNYLTKICEMAVKCFIDSSSNKVNCRGLVIAGCAGFKDQLVSSKMLDPRLQVAILSVVDVAYGGKQGLYQAIDLSSEVLKGSILLQEKKEISKFFEEISTDSGKFTFGVSETLAALESGAVETLLVWENLTKIRYSLKWEDKKKVVCLDPDVPFEEERNPNNEQWQVETSELLVDWFAENYKR